MRKLLLLIPAVAIVASVAALIRPAPAAVLHRSGPMQVGTNLDNVRDYGTAWPFTDLFKTSRPWISQNVADGVWDNGQPIALDAAGYPKLAPGQAAATIMGTKGHLPAGQYICTFEGTGDLHFDMDVRNVVRVSPNRYQFTVQSDGGLFLKILASSPADPVRNLRILLPDCDHVAGEFHPLFLERLKSFGVLRFMDWQSTNGSTLVHWADRTTPSSVRQASDNGVSLETMIDLANTLQADPWFCMPHLADDEFVEQFATMVKAKLAGDRKIYVEWSNETWNTMFPQGKWTADQAAARGEQPADVTAEQSQRVWAIWRRVFRDQASRVIRVAAGQQQNPAVAAEIVKHLNGDCDAIACSAYFCTRDQDESQFTASTTPGQIFDSMMTSLKENDLPAVAKHASLAASWANKLGRPMPLVIYEGGQNLLLLDAHGQLKPWHQATYDAESDPRMGVAYEKLLQGLSDVGVSTFCNFSFVGAKSQYGCWGALEYQDQPIEQAPKYATVVKWAEHAKTPALPTPTASKS